MTTTPDTEVAHSAGTGALEQPADEVVEASAPESHCCGGSSCATPTSEN